jgi:hypothetical protein
MYYCSPDRVVFLVARDEYAFFYQDDRKYITFSIFYNELQNRGISDGCRWSISPSEWHRGVSALEGTQYVNKIATCGCHAGSVIV